MTRLGRILLALSAVLFVAGAALQVRAEEGGEKPPPSQPPTGGKEKPQPAPSVSPPPVPKEQVARWVKDLAHGDDLRRREARRKLFQCGDRADPALAQAVKAADRGLAAEARRMRRLLAWRIHPERHDIEWLMAGYETRPWLDKLETVFWLEKLLDGPGLDVIRRIAEKDPSLRVREYAQRTVVRVVFKLGGGRGDLLTRLNRKGCDFLNKEEYEKAHKAFDEMLKTDPKNSTALYNKACTHARQGNVDEAVRYLEKAVRNGFTDREHIEHDKDLVNIRKDPRYLKIVEGLKE